MHRRPPLPGIRQGLDSRPRIIEHRRGTIRDGARRHVSGQLHETLWTANAELARTIRDHPFVRGLADGSLPAEAFRRYVAQDAFFLAAFARGYALAAARCEHIEDIAMFHELLGGVLDELRTHRGYATALGIDLDDVRPYAATRAYTDFLARTAWSGSLAETIAAMTPCMRLYAYLGSELAARGVPAHAYREWIRTYAADEFQALASKLENALDRLAEDSAAVREAYREAMRCELEFFDAPLLDQAPETQTIDAAPMKEAPGHGG